MKSLFHSIHYHALLFLIIISISACDFSDSAYYNNNDTRVIKLIATDNVVTAVVRPTPLASPTVSKEQESFSEKKQNNIRRLILENHYKKLTFNDVSEQTNNALQLNQYLQQLDPYSKYISAKQYRFIKARGKLRRTGAGFNLLIDNDDILIVPLPNTPLYQAGLKIPSYLVSINQHKINYHDFSTYAFLDKIKSGDPLEITVKQNNAGRSEQYSIIAEKYQRQLATYTEHSDYAMIRIDEFREGMQKKLIKFLKKLNNKKPLIIDLRYCPGGDLFTAVDMLSTFLGTNKKVAYLKKEKSYSPVLLKSIKSQRLFKRPIYLLTSRFTASSAEVFIRAIKHAVKNSHTIGTATQGKCFAQESYTLYDKSALSLSSYNILTPEQQNCDQIAIVPDRSVPNIELLPIEALLKYLP